MSDENQNINYFKQLLENNDLSGLNKLCLENQDEFKNLFLNQKNLFLSILMSAGSKHDFFKAIFLDSFPKEDTMELIFLHISSTPLEYKKYETYLKSFCKDDEIYLIKYSIQHEDTKKTFYNSVEHHLDFESQVFDQVTFNAMIKVKPELIFNIIDCISYRKNKLNYIINLKNKDFFFNSKYKKVCDFFLKNEILSSEQILQCLKLGIFYTDDDIQNIIEKTSNKLILDFIFNNFFISNDIDNILLEKYGHKSLELKTKNKNIF